MDKQTEGIGSLRGEDLADRERVPREKRRKEGCNLWESGGGVERTEKQIIFTYLFVCFQRIIVGIAAAEPFLIAFFFLQ